MKKTKNRSVRVQRDSMRVYLRTLKANYNRASRELMSSSMRWKSYPIEQHLRYHRFEEASAQLKLGESCLGALNHLYALRLAAYTPGDQVLVTTEMDGSPPDPRRYVIVDVEWRKRDTFIYVVWRVNKDGSLHRRSYPGWLCPSNLIRIEKCLEPLSKETERFCESTRKETKALFEDILANGDLSQFLPKPASQHQHVPVNQPYPFWLKT